MPTRSSFPISCRFSDSQNKFWESKDFHTFLFERSSSRKAYDFCSAACLVSISQLAYDMMCFGSSPSYYHIHDPWHKRRTKSRQDTRAHINSNRIRHLSLHLRYLSISSIFFLSMYFPFLCDVFGYHLLMHFTFRRT